MLEITAMSVSRLPQLYYSQHSRVVWWCINSTLACLFLFIRYISCSAADTSALAQSHPVVNSTQVANDLVNGQATYQ